MNNRASTAKSVQSKAVILCVDDEANSLFLRKLVLQKAGYQVVTATSAKQALEILSTDRIDLVLTDQLMPSQSGTELARNIKATRPKLPVIVLSGVNELPPDASFADLFMSKVEGPVVLCQKISEVLSTRSPVET
jgi:CheY-like chemotaxis protein